MICLATMRENHLEAAARWREEQDSRPPGRPMTGRERRKRLRAMRKELQRENAAKEKPDPVCSKCGAVHLKEDAGWLFRTCGTCEVRRIENLVWRIKRRHGRRQTIRLLRRLAGK